MSGAYGSQRRARQPAPLLTDRFGKTRLCSNHASGRCTNGSSCRFAHGADELRAPPDLYKTRICPAVAYGGICAFGVACTYAHCEEELRPQAGGAAHHPPVSNDVALVSLATLASEVQKLRAALAAMAGFLQDGRPGARHCGSRHPQTGLAGLPPTGLDVARAHAEGGSAIGDWREESEDVPVDGCVITTKNTFLHVEMLSSVRLGARRSRSSPPCEMAAWRV